MKLSLNRKIMLVVMGVIGALVLTSSVFLQYWIRREVTERLNGELAAAERVTREFLRARAERLSSLCASVAAAPRFRAVIEETDRQTIEDAGRDELKVVGGDLLLVTSARGQELGRIAPGKPPDRPPVIDAALRNHPGTDVWLVAGRLYQVAAQPVAFGGTVTAVLTLGQRLDESTAATLTDLVQATVVFDPPGDAAARKPEQEYRVRELALTDRAGVPVGRATLLRSMDEALAYLRRIQISLAMAACLVSLIGLALTAVVGRALTRPLFELMHATREVASGQYDHPVQVHSGDEMGLLAERFEEMRKSLRANIQKQVEEERLRGQMEIERHRSLSQMVAGVAHEINTPLGIVNSAASIFTETLTPAAVEELAKNDEAKVTLGDLREAARLIQNNIARADHLVQSFKNLSVRQVTDTLETVDMPNLVEEIVSLFRIKAKQAMISVTIADRLSPERAWTGYPGYFSQVLMNLLSNTARYAYPGNTGGTVEVELDPEMLEGQPAIALTVRDRGAGISPEHLPKVFEVFFTTGRAKGGSGLGLAIVDNLVRSAMHGTITVQSKPGEGAAFRVVLPRVISAPASAA